MDSSKFRDDILPNITGYGIMVLLFGGSVLVISLVSPTPAIRWMHVAVYLTAMFVFILRMIRKPKMNIISRFLPLLIALPVHYYLIVHDPANRKYFQYKHTLENFQQYMGGMFIEIPYAFIGLLAGVFIPVYALKDRQHRIRETGTDARAVIESAKDTQGRLTEGAHLQYEMRLILRIIDHPRSPYTVSGKFWVSEFFIHRLSMDQPIPVKVDRNDHRLVALNLFGKETDEKEMTGSERSSDPESDPASGEKMTAAYEGLKEGALYKNDGNNDAVNYLGGVARGARLELLKKEVSKDEFDRYVVYVKLLTNPVDENDEGIVAPASVNETGWIELEQTGFRNFFDPVNKVIGHRS